MSNRIFVVTNCFMHYFFLINFATANVKKNIHVERLKKKERRVYKSGWTGSFTYAKLFV